MPDEIEKDGAAEEGAKTTEKTSEPSPEALKLSQDLVTAQERIRDLENKDRVREVDDKIRVLSAKWSDNPALLTRVKGILLSDDGRKVAKLHFSEDGVDKEVDLSVSEAVESVLGLIPKEIKLSDVTRTGDHFRPPANADGEEMSAKEKAEAAAEALGISMTLSKGPRRREAAK